MRRCLAVTAPVTGTLSPSTSTERSRHSGKNRVTGASRSSSPSSTNIMAATLVIGLVIE